MPISVFLLSTDILIFIKWTYVHKILIFDENWAISRIGGGGIGDIRVIVIRVMYVNLRGDGWMF